MRMLFCCWGSVQCQSRQIEAKLSFGIRNERAAQKYLFLCNHDIVVVKLVFALERIYDLFVKCNFSSCFSAFYSRVHLLQAIACEGQYTDVMCPTLNQNWHLPA